MRMRKTAGLAAAMLAAMPSLCLAADETVSAFSVWTGKGQYMQTAPNELTFVGSLEGDVYVNTEEGPVEAGRMVCPSLVRIDMTNSTQTATGNCTIALTDGAQLFTEVNCKGVHLVGCSGDMKITGGNGRLANATGGGEITIRSSLQNAKPSTPTSGERIAHGIMFWPELKYALP